MLENKPSLDDFDLVDPAEVWRAIERVEASMHYVVSTRHPPRTEACISEDDFELIVRALRQQVGRS